MIKDNIRFENRESATKELLKVMPIENMLKERWIVLAVSLESINMAKTISKTLNGDFDFIFTEKIKTFNNNDCNIAIISETSDIIINEELKKAFGISTKDIYESANNKYKIKIVEHKAKYRNSLDIIDLEDKNVLLIDEGLNTGLTMMTCIKSVINQKAKSVCVAVPILPEIIIDDIEEIADDLYYVYSPKHFVSINFYYKSLEKIVKG